MKIAFIVGMYPTPFFINNQIVGLINKGHNVDIYAFKEIFIDISGSDLEKYNLDDYLTYFAIPVNKFLRILKAVFLFITNLHKGPLKLINALNFFKYGKNTINLNTFYYVLPFLNSNYDILHCHFGPNGIVGSLLKEIGIKGKLVTTFYGYDLSSYITLNGTNVYKLLFKNCDLFFPICKYFRDKLIEFGCNPNKIKVNYINIDCNRYKFKKRIFHSGETLEILTVAVFEGRKGYEYSLKAIAKLVEMNKDIRYTIAGDGENKQKIMQLIDDLNIKNYINYVGRVNQKELIKLYDQAHVFLLPSITADGNDQEGTPTVILEAQATGLPVISTNHSGIPEIILDNESGFIVPEKDVFAITEKLNFFIDNSDALEIMGYKGREFIKQKFDMQESNNKLENAYKDLL